SFGPSELAGLLRDGTRALEARGLATTEDVDRTEARGRIDEAEPDHLSERAIERGRDQCGTIGAGNHFLEVQVVDRVVDAEKAAAMGLFADQICVTIHSGSRGLGYQACDDALRDLRGVPEKYGNDAPDRQPPCRPIPSPAG